MNFTKIFRIEYIKLFRYSNILFFFLFVYMVLTTLTTPFQFSFSNQADFELENFYSTVINSISIVGLLLVSIFMVNNIGNDFNEGSYRRMIAIGLEKREYFIGKLFLIILFSILVIITGLLSYFLLGLIILKLPLLDLLFEIQGFSLINQFGALIQAGLFGAFFIVLFRNRIIGLVFFPFWFITESIFYLVDKIRPETLYPNYWPGVSMWSLFNSLSFDASRVLIFFAYSVLFLTISWISLKKREEKTQG